MARIVGEPHELFPKSHSNCVRLMGGAIGWLRPEQGEGVPPVLPASGTLLGAEDAEEALGRLLESNGSAMASDPELRHLAEDVLKEFKESLVVRDDPLKGAELAAANEALFQADAEKREDAAHAWQSLKKLGNEAVKAGLIWPAEASYRAALEEGASVVPATEASLIESNRALALLKGGHHLEAAAAADQALQHDPKNAKAAYRLAQALLEMPGPGAKELRAAEEAARRALRLEPKDAKIADMLRRATKLVEQLPLEVSESPSAATAEEVLDAMD